jgi:predicted DNA repair protein MutK
MSVSGNFNHTQRAVCRGLLIIAPLLMKTPSIVGTTAMFLVSSGILVHNISFIHYSLFTIHYSLEPMLHSVSSIMIAAFVVPILLDGVVD